MTRVHLSLFKFSVKYGKTCIVKSDERSIDNFFFIGSLNYRVLRSNLFYFRMVQFFLKIISIIDYKLGIDPYTN